MRRMRLLRLPVPSLELPDLQFLLGRHLTTIVGRPCSSCLRGSICPDLVIPLRRPPRTRHHFRLVDVEAQTAMRKTRSVEALPACGHGLAPVRLVVVPAAKVSGAHTLGRATCAPTCLRGRWACIVGHADRQARAAYAMATTAGTARAKARAKARARGAKFRWRSGCNSWGAQTGLPLTGSQRQRISFTRSSTACHREREADRA